MPTYYPINETTARRAKEMNSFSDYTPGSATAAYRQEVDKAAAIAEAQKARVDPMYHEKIDRLLDTYARKLAENINIWLSNPTAVEYIRNTLKRVRKKESSLIMASQNLEDFDVPGVREMTRPLFAIPTHQFLFNAGNVDKRFYMDNLQLEASEFELIAQI